MIPKGTYFISGTNIKRRRRRKGVGGVRERGEKEKAEINK